MTDDAQKYNICIQMCGQFVEFYNRLTDVGKVVSPTHRPLSTAHKHYFSVSGTHFC
jgi:hypothetical protein